MEEINTVYNRFGKPIFRILSDGRFVTFPGKNMGFLVNDSLYNYNGKHVGWFSEGLVRDHHGQVVGFGESVSDNIHPFLPYTQYKPYAGYLQYEPHRPFLQYEPYRPYKSYSWSNIPLESLFD